MRKKTIHRHKKKRTCLWENQKISWKPRKKIQAHAKKKPWPQKKKVPHGSLLTLWRLVRYFFLLGLVDYIYYFIFPAISHASGFYGGCLPRIQVAQKGKIVHLNMHLRDRALSGAK